MYALRLIVTLLFAFLRLLQIIKKIFIPVPGWNKNCKERHKKARRSFKIWRTAGKIRHGPVLYMRI